jgi:hypothetical protein
MQGDEVSEFREERRLHCQDESIFNVFVLVREQMLNSTLKTLADAKTSDATTCICKTCLSCLGVHRLHVSVYILGA